MNRLKLFAPLLLAFTALATTAHATTTYSVGYISYDVTSPGFAEFDITNETGSNASTLPDTTFPISTALSLTGLSLAVDFASGPAESFGASYFTLAPDGLSFNGTSESTLAGQPSGFEGADSATLKGTFSTTSISLTDGTPVTILSTFTVTFSDPSGLSDGDLGVIEATEKSSGGGGGTSPVPEPDTLAMVGTGLVSLAGLRRRMLGGLLRRLSKAKGAAGVGVVLAAVFAVLLPMTASASTSPVKLSADTSPSSGLAGVTFVNITGSGVPTGTVTPSAVTVSLSKSCMGASPTTTKASSVTKVIGTSDRFQFEIPSSLATGTYYATISGTTTGGTAFASSNCSEVVVTNSTPTLAACVPTSSLAVTVGTNVDAFIPFSSWEYNYLTGIERVALEGTNPAHNFATPGPVNSCAANSVTGEVICTENSSNLDVINGSTVTTLVTASNQQAGFTGGDCYNCGVGINPTTNTAVIAMGLSGGGGSGVQALNLSNNTFNTGFPLQNYVSEDISIDSGRNLILSPAEDSTYDLMKIGAGNTLTEYGNVIGGGDLDSAAEDCTTGIALSADEFTDQIYITDLTQAVFTDGTGGAAGTWTAPGQFFQLTDGGYAAGVSGITSAPGTGHLAAVTGEFGGSAYSALKLPSTSGTGTPTLVDHAYVGSMPNTPDGVGFSAGYDPHTITAYTSPNTGKSYAVFADYANGGYNPPTYLGVVDLACVLALPRAADNITVNGNASTCTRYVAIP